jgi:hypothetical protein
VQNVGKFCNQKDHHPEWESANGGKSIKVKLTSHFAGNKVTLFDFELAESMNANYKIAQKSFTPYPFITDRAWSSVLIFIGFYVVSVITLSFFANIGHPYPSSAQRG